MLDAFVTEFGSFYRNPRHEAVCVSFFDSLHDLFNTLNRLSRYRHHLFNNNKTPLPTLSWSNIKNVTKPETEQF